MANASQLDAHGVSGLSTTVANEHLVEEVEVIVNRYFEHVKTSTWKSRFSFLETHEGAVALFCSAVFAFVAVYTFDTRVFAEVMLVLPFLFVAWYISFRLPRVEQLRAIAKVQDCIQRFIASEDAFTQSTRAGSGADKGYHEAMPPSSFCVSVLRDGIWRQIPYNMVVEGDIFKLRDGGVLPCRAERLSVRKQRGALRTGEIFAQGEVFTSAWSTSAVNANGDSLKTPCAISSFVALSTACVPVVHKFLQSAQRFSEGRMDTVFFELAALVRERLKKTSLVLFLVLAAAWASWFASPAVAEQGIAWQLHRALLLFRLIVCLLPLMPVILLQITDVWGNARIQSLFEWHAGSSGECGHPVSEEISPGGGENFDASHVPLQWQLQELIDILRQGLDGPSNLMHTLNSTTVVCFCDKEGLLTDTCTSIAEVCVCSSEPTQKEETLPDQQDDQIDAGHTREAPPWTHASGSSEEAHPPENVSPFHTVVLDVQPDVSAPSGLRFEDLDWRNLLPVLKPLGLAMAVSRQPRAPCQFSNID